jgi:hypothetical protein
LAGADDYGSDVFRLVLFAHIVHLLSVKHVRVDAAQNSSIKNQSRGAFFDEPYSAGSARISMRRMRTFATKGFFNAVECFGFF